MSPVLKLSLRNLANNKLRFLLTTFAVFLGVSFVVSSFVMTDGLMRTFDNLLDEGYSGIDVEIRAADDFAEVDFVDRPFDEAVLDTVRDVDGVGELTYGLSSMKVVPLKDDGTAIETSGAPVFTVSWADTSMDRFDIVEGVAPAGPGEFTIDRATANRDDFVVGRTYDVVGATGREPFELVGLTQFGDDENSLAGAVIVSMTLDEVQRLDQSEGLLQWISVSAADGVDRDTLIRHLEAAMPSDMEAVGGDVAKAEDRDDFAFFIDIFGNVLLSFALVAVFVSTFIISNTFNILFGQRVRQLALLRALGASARQVRSSALIESLIVGVSASALGLGGGVLLAMGLQEVMSAMGFELPKTDVIIAPRTIIVALIVGVGVTLLASLTPARRASNVPPVAAMRAGFRYGSGEGTRRTIIAIVLSAFGLAAIAYGLWGGAGTAVLLISLGLGAVLVFVAVSMFAPLFSTPSARFLGAPLEHVPGNQVTGHMARQNASSNNKRTASTAAGLMIGLALVAMASVVAESFKDTFKAELGSTMIADYVITGDNDVAFSPELADEVAALPYFDAVSAVRWGNVRIAGDGKGVAATDLTVLTDLLDVNVVEGDPGAAADEQHVVISREAADDLGVSVGDPVMIEFAAIGTFGLEVGAIYENEFLIGHYVIDLSAWDRYFSATDDNVISARIAEGVDPEQADAALRPLEQSFPSVNFETATEWNDRLEGQLDSLLIIINVFLGLAIIIALLGIGNTMALSVIERTREIGLMRAIGMTRRQTRGMIRLEAAVISLFGALLGVVVGLAFGWLAVLAVPETVISRLTIPYWTLAVYVVIATIAGVVAATAPARRASRLKVLDAISHE